MSQIEKSTHRPRLDCYQTAGHQQPEHSCPGPKPRAESSSKLPLTLPEPTNNKRHPPPSQKDFRYSSPRALPSPSARGPSTQTRFESTHHPPPSRRTEHVASRLGERHDDPRQRPLDQAHTSPPWRSIPSTPLATSACSAALRAPAFAAAFKPCSIAEPMSRVTSSAEDPSMYLSERESTAVRRRNAVPYSIRQETPHLRVGCGSEGIMPRRASMKTARWWRPYRKPSLVHAVIRQRKRPSLGAAGSRYVRRRVGLIQAPSPSLRNNGAPTSWSGCVIANRYCGNPSPNQTRLPIENAVGRRPRWYTGHSQR